MGGVRCEVEGGQEIISTNEHLYLNTYYFFMLIKFIIIH